MNATETTEFNGLKEENKLLSEKVSSLEEQLNWFRRNLFGKRSEKIVSGGDEQLFFEGFKDLEPSEPESQDVGAHKRKKRKLQGSDKLKFPEDLPIKKTFLDVSEDEKICPKTGKALVKIGEEITTKLAHKPASFFLRQMIRPKYALPDGEGIVCAELPESLLPRCKADESLLAELLVNKFGDHLPLYRTEEIWRRQGIRVTRQLLSQWVLNSSMALEPLFNEMLKVILKSGTVFIDESPVSMLAPGKGKTHQAYMWVVAGGGLCVYDFRENRKHINAEKILKDFKGVFHSDKYGAYVQLAQKPELTWCPCWAHIRRKFFEAETGDPAFRKWMLRHIRYLFMLDRIALSRSADERLRIRQEKQIPLIDKMIEACKLKLENGKILPKSKLRGALGYFYSLIPYLKNYAYHPDARLDNNTAERAIRPLAIGRKNWMFVGSKRGGKAAAIIISLVQSCRGLKINPRDYLEDVMRRIMSHPANKLRELLPDQWAAARAK